MPVPAASDAAVKVTGSHPVSKGVLTAAMISPAWQIFLNFDDMVFTLLDFWSSSRCC
jgi:hypothetical protein